MPDILQHINRALEGWIQLCTGQRQQNGLDEEHYRQRILVTTSLLWLFVVVVLTIVTPLLIDLTPEGAAAAALLFVTTGFSVLVSMLVLRHLDNRILAMHLLLLVYTGAFAIACLYFGGTRSPTFALLIMAPVMAAIVGSNKATLFWGSLVLLIWSALLGLERIGMEFRQIIAPQNYNVALTLAYAAMGLGVVSIIMAYAETNKRLRTTLNHANSELAFLSSHDDLTGLYNRRFYDQRMARSLARSAELGQPLGLIFFDLNEFKLVNDTHGHGVGDRLLEELGRRLRSEIRETDLIARLGGDEFAVILENVHSPADVEKVADKLMTTVEQPLVLRNQAMTLSASFGVAMYPTHGQSRKEIEERADRAMYRAKHGSRRVAAAAVGA